MSDQALRECHQARNRTTQVTIAATKCGHANWHGAGMRNNKNQPRLGNGFLPKTLTFQQAEHYTGLSIGTLENYARAGLITVSNMIMPGATRGRKLIDRKSLDHLIDECVGNATTAVICPKKGGASR